MEFLEFKFSERELDILACLICGKSAKSMAKVLSISSNTVNTHIRKISEKLGISCQDNIIMYLEETELYLKLKDRYLKLLSIYEFETILQALKLSLIPSHINVFSPDSSISKKIQKHLNLLKITPRFIEANTIESKIELNFSKISINNVIEYIEVYIPFLKKLALEKDLEYISKLQQKLSSRFVNHDPTPKPKILKKSYKKNALVGFSLLTCFVLLAYFLRQNSNISNINLPYNLINRPNLISKIDYAFNTTKQNTVVLFGIGGSGKTTLAKMYLKLRGSKLSWQIYSNNFQSFFNSFKDLANCITKSPSLKNDLQNILSISDIKIRMHKLVEFTSKCLERYKNWYLLFDDVVESNLINEYLSTGTFTNGRIIFTTRNQFLLKEISQKAVLIDELSYNEKYKLFTKIFPNISLNKSNVNLFEKIPSYPLDVSSAAYYIKFTGTDLYTYQNLFWKNKNCNKLQREINANNMNYTLTRNDILSGIFKDIISRNQDYAKLLMGICLGSEKFLPIDFLKNYFSKDLVDGFVYLLKNYHILTQSKNDVYEIHKSFQEVGLAFLKENIPSNLLNQYLEKYIIKMTPYHKLAWSFYGSREKMDLKSRHFYLMQLESLNNKINYINNNYKNKILLAIAYASEDIKSYSEIQKILNKLFSEQTSKYFLSLEDFIPMLIYSIYIDHHIGVSSQEVLHKANTCLKLCRNKFIYQKCMCLTLMLREYFKFDFNSVSNIEKEIDNNIQKLSKEERTVIQCWKANQYYRGAGNYAINEEKTYDAIKYLLLAINTLCGKKLFHKDKHFDGKIPLHISELRLNLTRAYNKTGQYDKALESANECEFLYNKIQMLSGISLKQREQALKTEKGIIFLRKNLLFRARNCFSELVKLICSPRESFFQYAYLAEINIRLNKLDEAMKFCKLAENNFSLEKSNFAKLTEGNVLYHMAVIEYKKGNITECFKYMEKFLTHMNFFCRNFLKKEKFDQLKEQSVFLANQEIKNCFFNAKKIYTCIYGSNHPFIMQYVNHVLDETNWFTTKFFNLKQYFIYSFIRF